MRQRSRTRRPRRTLVAPATIIVTVAIMLACVATAAARQAVHGRQETAILRALGSGIAPQCVRAWVSTVRPDGRTWAFVTVVGYRGACSDQQPGDSAFLHFTGGRWRAVTQDDEVSCRNGAFPQVPLRVQYDLLGCGR